MQQVTQQVQDESETATPIVAASPSSFPTTSVDTPMEIQEQPQQPIIEVTPKQETNSDLETTTIPPASTATPPPEETVARTRTPTPPPETAMPASPTTVSDIVQQQQQQQVPSTSAATVGLGNPGLGVSDAANVSSPFAKQPVKITSKLTPNAPEWTPNPNAAAFKSSPLPSVHNQNAAQEDARKLLLQMQQQQQPRNDIPSQQSEIDQLSSVVQSLNQSSGQNINIQSVQDAALAIQSSQELTEALASLDQANEQNNAAAAFGQGKIDEAQILASKLIGQLQDNTISNPALLLQHLLGFAPEDYNDLVTALSESGCNYIEIVAAYLHNIQVQAQENNGNNPGVAMAARQGVISKYNYLISELNKFKAMKDPATNLLNVAKHVQGQYDPAIQSLLQQRAAAAGYGGQLQGSYSALSLPHQQVASPYGRADPYTSLQQQLGAAQLHSSITPPQNSNSRLPNNLGNNLGGINLGGVQLSDILPQLDQDKHLQEQQLQQLLELQRYQQLLGGEQQNRGTELGDQSKHLTSLGLQTMYGGMQRQPPQRQPTPPAPGSAASKPMWSFNSSMF